MAESKLKMRPGRVVRNLLIISGSLYAISYAACREDSAHDQSGLCVIDPFMPPPFLGFEYWSEAGIALAVAATGLVVAGVIFWRNNS